MASSIPCVTKTMVLRSADQIRNSSSCRLRRVSASSAPKGSSMSSMGGSMASSRPKATFASTVIQGKSAYSWKTIPRSGPGPATGLPFASSVPAVGGANPAMALRRVDFPQPDGPSKQTSSPGATLRSIPSSASTSRPPVRKALARPVIWTAGSTWSALHPAVPAQEPAVEAVHEDVDAEPAQADGDHPGDDLVGPHELARLEDAVAKPPVHRRHLGHDDDDEGDPDPHPHAGEDVGHGSRHDDAPEEHALPRAEVLGGPNVDGVDVPHAGDGVDEHREEGAERDEEERGRVAEPEPQDGERDEGDGRDGPQHLQERGEEVVDERPPAHEEPERQRHPAPDEEAGQHAREAPQRVLRQLAGKEPGEAAPLRRVVGLERREVLP